MTDKKRLEAAAWAERLASESREADHRRFDQWREEDGHAALYGEMVRTRRIVSDLAETAELQSLRRAALSRAIRGRLRPRRAWAPLAAAAAAIGALTFTLPAVFDGSGRAPADMATAPAIYRTGIGQTLAVRLEDGSKVTLDAVSRLRVAYTGDERRLLLEGGQALFDVAQDASRPFVVGAAGQQVVAHGTAFNIRVDPARVRVALIEGRVTVASSGAGAVAMRPNRLLTAGPDGISLRRDRAAVDALTSWRDGRLTVEDQPLAAVVAEMNRYAAKPIVLEGDVGRLRISGSFRTNEVEPFLQALELGFPVNVRRRSDGAAVLNAA